MERVKVLSKHDFAEFCAECNRLEAEEETGKRILTAADVKKFSGAENIGNRGAGAETDNDESAVLICENWNVHLSTGALSPTAKPV
jgi:hypothetical protein